MHQRRINNYDKLQPQQGHCYMHSAHTFATHKKRIYREAPTAKPIRTKQEWFHARVEAKLHITHDRLACCRLFLRICNVADALSPRHNGIRDMDRCGFMSTLCVQLPPHPHPYSWATT
jgi:hypothetical protein